MEELFVPAVFEQGELSASVRQQEVLVLLVFLHLPAGDHTWGVRNVNDIRSSKGGDGAFASGGENCPSS